MEQYDISRPVTESMSVYKNRESKKFKRRVDATYQDKGLNESSIVQWNLHTGTHVDAPFHMLDQGKTMEAIPLEPFFGSCYVADLSFVKEVITKKDLESVLPSPLMAKRVLLKTKNSEIEEYDPAFVYLSEEGANYLVQLGLILVGIDGMSVERDTIDHPAHRSLLSNEVEILEDVRLKEVEEGYYQLIALPLALQGSEASPVRAILLRP